MFRAILSLIIRSVLTVITASGFIHVCRRLLTAMCLTTSTIYSTRPTTFYVWKTRGCQCSFRLLMMGGVSPETCWVSYKYGTIKFWYIVACCWISSLWIVLWCTDPRTSTWKQPTFFPFPSTLFHHVRLMKKLVGCFLLIAEINLHAGIV